MKEFKKFKELQEFKERGRSPEIQHYQ